MGNPNCIHDILGTVWIFMNDKSALYWKKQDEEKTALLLVSEKLASIQQPKDLFQVVFELLQPTFKFDQAVVVLYNEELTHSKHLFHFDPRAEAPDRDQFYKKLMAEELPIEDSIYQEIVEAEEPKIISWMYLNDNYGHTVGVQSARSFGFKELLFMPMSFAGKRIGSFEFLSKTQNRFSQNKLLLYQNIGNQMAGAISNLIANEKVARAMEEIQQLNHRLKQHNDYLEEEVAHHYNAEGMISESFVMKNVLQNVKLVGKTDTTVLIIGESGTGKELIARAIHKVSNRSDKTLIKINCATLPAQLIESELFGHEKGAFTGAVQQRIGKFELAVGGTLFLDEIGELPLDLQAKLLRVLQEREIERLGGNEVIKTDVRIISATNRNLLEEVEKGNFRSDLYYRLNVFPIALPPLRERKEEVEHLAFHFLKKNSKKLGKPLKGISKNALKKLQSYDWPGNIRELEHVIERSAILTTTSQIEQVHLPSTQLTNNMNENSDLVTLAENEKQHILKALKHTNGKVSGYGGAAELLEIKPTTLEYRMKKLGIRKKYS